MCNDSEIARNELREWISTAVSTNAHCLGRGYQGCTYLYEKDGRRLVIKVPTGRGPARWIRRRLLYHEYRVYSMLKDADGVPECHGFLDGSYLILEYVDGPSIRKVEISDPMEFHKMLFACIQGLHARGVAHGDLKKKDNILVIDNRYPFLVDFGVAIIRNAGWAPVNHYLYSLFQRFDNNAWIKHKYNRKTDRICEEDLLYYNRTWIESIAGVLKHCYLKMKKQTFSRVPFMKRTPKTFVSHCPPEPSRLLGIKKCSKTSV